jgi:hypothetical protein
MHIVVGPALNEEGRLCLRRLDAREGPQHRFTYDRIEDAHYARNVEIRSRKKGYSDHKIACSTVDDFERLTI